MKLPNIDDLKLDNKKILLIALVTLTVVYFDFSFLAMAQIGYLRSMKPKIIKLQRDIAAFDKSSVDIKRLKGQQREPTASAKQVVPESELPDLLEYISDAGNKNNVRIMQIRPAVKEEKPKDGKAVSVSQFTPAYISLDIFSNYHSLGNFINELESGEKFIAVQDLKIARDKGDYMRQEVNLTLKTYVKK
jgi:Tfp pilus assembly protein PilO